MVDNQLFLDHGPDSFLAQIISLVKIVSLHIDIDDEWRPNKVRIQFKAEQLSAPLQSQHISLTEYGRSYGEALYKVREALRMEIGQ